MITSVARNREREKRHLRIRKKVSGTAERPRLCVFRSLNNIYAQIIDDVKGITLVAASSLEKDIKGQIEDKGKQDVAKLVGNMVARRALEKNITKVVFDRAGYKYHGRIKNLGDGAREQGLVF
ncbi:MAG: 50S ribosomal protein L18 [Candidatus Eremiobacterota bacterium]